MTEETCQTCNGRGLIPCPSHGTQLDEDGWCTTCGTPMDGEPAGETTCPCNQD